MRLPGFEVRVIGGQARRKPGAPLREVDWSRWDIERYWRVGPLRFVTLGWRVVCDRPMLSNRLLDDALQDMWDSGADPPPRVKGG